MDNKPSAADRQALAQKLNQAPAYEMTAEDVVSRFDVSSVRLSGNDSRASINGQIYRVGETVDEGFGLVFAGHDPEGEYLLFRDAEKRVHLFSLFRE